MATEDQFIKRDKDGKPIEQLWILEDGKGALAEVTASTPKEAWQKLEAASPELKDRFSNPMFNYTIQPKEGYSKRTSEIEGERLQDVLAEGPQYKDREGLGEYVADFAFPIGSAIARRGGSKEKIISGASADAFLNALPFAAGRAVANTGLSPAKQFATRALAEGLTGGVASGTQELASTGEISPLGVGLGVLAPAAFEGAGMAGRRLLQGTAKKGVTSVIKTPTRQEYKPSAEYALEHKLVPYFGGVDEMGSRVGENLGTLGNIREAMFSEGGAYAEESLNPFDISIMAKEIISNDKKMLQSDRVSAKRVIDNQLKYLFGPDKSRLNAGEALDIKSAMFEKAKSTTTPRGKMTPSSKAYDALGRAIDENLSMVAPEAKNVSRAMAPLMAWKQSIQSAGPRINRNLGISMGDLLAAGAFGNSLGKIGAVGGRRLTATLGGARGLYEAGKAAEYLAPVGGQIGRLGAIYNPDERMGETLSDHYPIAGEQ